MEKATTNARKVENKVTEAISAAVIEAKRASVAGRQSLLDAQAQVDNVKAQVQADIAAATAQAKDASVQANHTLKAPL